MSIPFAEDILHLVERHQYLGLFLLLLLEESGVPLPVPGDGLMLFAGYRVAAGHLSFLPAFAVIEVATVIGASILRLISCRGGRPLLYRYGRFIHLDRSRLDQAEFWLAKHGRLTILLGRLIPGLRIPTSIACGVFEIPYRVFLPYVSLGSALYILFFLTLGLGLGRESRRIVRIFWLHPLIWGTAGLLLLAAAVLVVSLWRNSRLREWRI